MELPSDRQLDDIVSLSFLNTEKIRNCIIAGVRFIPGKVFYDVKIPILVKGKEQGHQLVRDIPSDFVTK